MRGSGFLTALWLLAAAPPIVGQAPTDYPQWRGKSRDGSASAFVAPTSWPAVLAQGWTRDVGAGYATPLVVSDVVYRSEEHTSELQSRENLVCRLLLEKKKK